VALGAAVAAGAFVETAVAPDVAAGATVAGGLVGSSRLAAVGVDGTRVATGALAAGVDRGPQAATRLPRLPMAVSCSISRRVSLWGMAVLLGKAAERFYYTTGRLEEREKPRAYVHLTRR
jgi:hypothetical protein